MKRIRVAALSILFVLIGSGLAAPGCFDDAASETCTIKDRDSSSITVRCVDSDGEERIDVHTETYSDLYPKCQIGTKWPTCKEK